MRFDLLFVFLGFLWAIAGPLVKNLDHIPLALIIAMRGGIGGALVFAYSFRIERWRVSGVDFWISAVMGWATGLTFIACIHYVNTAVAFGLFYAVMPITVCLLSKFFLHEKTAGTDWAAALALIPCMILLSWDKFSFDNSLGLASGVASGIFYSIFAAATKRIDSDGERMASLGLGSLGCLILLPFGLDSQLALSPSDLALILSLGVINQAAPVMLTSYLFSHAPNIRRGVICMSLQILFAIGLSALFSADMPSLKEVVACVLILVVVAGQTMSRQSIS